MPLKIKPPYLLPDPTLLPRAAFPGLVLPLEASFVPSQVTGLFASPSVAQCRGAGLLWQDAGKTTAASADGDPVRVVRCPFTGVEFTAAVDGQRPLLKSGGGALWYLLFDGTDDFLAFAGPASKPLSVHMSVRVTNLSLTGPAFGSPPGGQKLKIVDPGAANKMRAGKEGVYNWTESGTAATVNVDFVGGVSYASTGAATYYRNAAADGVGDADVSDDTFTANLSRIGANTTATEMLIGRVYGWAIYAAGLGANDNIRVQRWLGALAGLSL